MTALHHRIALFAGAAFVIAGSVAPARAAAATIVAGPAASSVGYVTPAAIAVTAAPLTFVNVDNGAMHDVTADQYTTGKPWCGSYTAGHCPAFRTDLVSFGKTATVDGIASLAPGVYTFHCSLHGAMKGTLVVA